jgi:hypothetical protein
VESRELCALHRRIATCLAARDRTAHGTCTP